MDDSCVVCADELDWVAYGACGHRDVCSTCVARLRFVIGDRRCCICKTDNPCVFITKAMGDYTRVITDFSLFPANSTEGKTGQYWYHEGIQAFFDDAEQYKMIRAMCRLSCSVCDKNAEEQDGEATKRRTKFKSIEQLKGHLYHQHRLFMCSLCLEGRKVFICEQKLYTRSQLNRHMSTGDSEVDGSESERGGFMGHPFCEFCRTPFYGENELYMHMSTEHYTCHICQRQHPGQYEYYRNYDDLETHFRREHFLCENEACLEKKFIVFQSEAELKRHNALEHGGHMSRSKRNAVLQIPTSFRYRRATEREQRRGRGRGFHSGPPDDQLSTAIQASLETAISDSRHGGQSSGVGRRQTDIMTGSLETMNINSDSTSSPTSVTNAGLEESSFPPLSDREPSETSSRYAQALGQGPITAARLREESFPPLPGTEKSRKPKSKPDRVGLGQNTLSARLQLRNRVGVLNSARPRASESYERSSSSSTSTSHVRPEPTSGLPSSSASGPIWPTPQEVVPSSSASLVKPRENGFTSLALSKSARNSSTGNREQYSSSGPNLEDGRSLNQALAPSNQSLPKLEDVQAANKTLVERIRAGLGMDDDKYAVFRSISAEYRQGVINSSEYLSYVEQFGLSNLVLELARLCPDAQKQKELVDAYNASIQAKVQVVNGEQNIAASKEKHARKEKGKGKAVDRADFTSTRDSLAENFIDSVRKLQSSQKPQEEEKIEVLSKDGYRTGNSKLQESSANAVGSCSNFNSTQQNTGLRDSSKQRRKTSKFHRIRLGDDSAAPLRELGHSHVSPEMEEESIFERGKTQESGQGLPVRGVWRNGGGLKLVASQRDYSK